MTRLLDVACGSGGPSLAIASAMTGCHMTGVDIEAAGIAEANHRAVGIRLPLPPPVVRQKEIGRGRDLLGRVIGFLVLVHPSGFETASAPGQLRQLPLVKPILKDDTTAPRWVGMCSVDL